MGLVTATISITDQQVPPVAVDGVTVQVFDETGVTLQTSGVTGAGGTSGEVDFVLMGTVAGTTYRLRFYQTGTSITNPQDIVVTDPANPTNIFDVTAQTHTLPVATDVNMCRCSGYFYDPAGQPIEGLTFFFVSKMEPPTPQMVGTGDTAVAIMGKAETETDSDGYVVVDLYRDAEYDVVLSRQENVTGEIIIPDAASANLVHVLYPTIANVVYNPVSPAAVAVGSTTDVALTLTYSSGVTRFTGGPPVSFTSSDDDVATGVVAGSDETDVVLTITSVGAGTCTLTPTREFGTDEQEIIALPALISLPTITVNVA